MVNERQYIKITDCAFNTYLRQLFGDTEDEYGEDYSKVYNKQLGSIYNRIGEFIKNAEENKIELTEDILSGAVMFRWYCAFKLGVHNKKVFKQIAKFILITLKRVKENHNYI